MGSATGHAASSTPATYYYYDGWDLIQEGPGGTTVARTYVHGGRVDEIVASQAGGEWVYHHYDARGHCILLTRASDGTIREQYDYDAFGYPYFYNAFGVKLGSAAQFGNRFLFTGREWLKDLRVYDYRNRIYQPELGRFLQPDPTGFEGGDYNLYRYYQNDPVNKSDPMGLQVTSDTWNDKMRFQSGTILSSREFSLLREGQAYLAPPTGNYKDPNVKNHIRNQSKPGITRYTLDDAKEIDGKLVITPSLNWWVKPGFENRKVILGELGHVSRWLWWQGRGGDGQTKGDGQIAIDRFNKNPNGLGTLNMKIEGARFGESVLQDTDIHARNRHSIDKNPKLMEVMTSTEIEKAIGGVKPLEDPRGQYLGY